MLMVSLAMYAFMIHTVDTEFKKCRRRTYASK